MKISSVTPLLLCLSLPSCGSPSPANPTVLYLANDVFETQVKLVDVEPPPF